MIKIGIDLLNPTLCRLFNHVITTECYPKSWSNGYIIPIYKKGSATDPSNYRGITISSCLGKLFALLLNTRLQKYLEVHNIISMYQIGFQKNKRTSDHLFVLKCLIEEAKYKRQPIYGCFIDFRKAFDTVWTDVLLYKMISKYSISPKIIRLLSNMYSSLTGQACIDGHFGSPFNIEIGTRQGCNLSPLLFNLFINDLPTILEKGKCNPVSLGTLKLNALMYADDTLILSKSKTGLDKALRIMEVYCRKWQLKINTDKTKIMIFIKRKIKNCSFVLNGHLLENVNTYNYLGLKISSSGSFIAGVKELAQKAFRAYIEMKSSFMGMDINPRLYIKLFDSLVKPIALYGCEVWGSFGHKVLFTNKFYFNDNSPYEKLHLKMCKQILKVSKRTSNFGSRSELGRMPLMFNIIYAMCKYRIRLDTFDNTDLLYYALESQKNKKHNSYKTITYPNVMGKLFREFNLDFSPSNQHSRNYSNFLKTKLSGTYSNLFKDSISELHNNQDTKLAIYSDVKTKWGYESYLNSGQYRSYITKFRLSDHFLPIERGRYLKPKIPRHDRICTLCNDGLGNEVHALFECTCSIIRKSNSSYMDRLSKISFGLHKLPNYEKLLYLLTGHDHLLTPIIGEWLCKINTIYRKSLS